jgi:endoglucanase
MEDITPFLKELISLPGLSGYEDPVRSVIAEHWRPLVDELSVSKLGSLHGLKHATIPQAQGSLLLATHMDAIGLMISGYSEGLLRVTSIGGIDSRILPGQAVIVHGKRELPGIAVLLPDKLLKANQRELAPEMKRVLVDTGLNAVEIRELVRIGDLISFATPPVELEGGYLSGHSLDNRASVAALTLCLEEIKNAQLNWNVWAVATVQEEETLGGALTSAFEIQPDLAIAIDVTFAKGPGASDYRAFPLGSGVTIGVGANLHPYLLKQLKAVANEFDIPYSIEVMAVSSGTDAIFMQISEGGIPCEAVSIPLRYMHTPVEEIAMADIKQAARLLSKFISSLDGNTMTSLQKEMLT